LHAAEFAGPVAIQVFDALVAALDDAQRVEQLIAEEIGTAAVIGQRRVGGEDFVFAETGAEVAFQAPERGQHRRGDAVLLFDVGEQRGVLLDDGLAVGDAGAAGHAVGELDEGLLEHTLAVIAAHDGGIEGHVGRGFGNHLGGDTLRLRVFLEGLKPALEAAGVVAAWRDGHRLAGEQHAGRGHRKFQHCRPHRSCHFQ
jgi:hypothetical protein